MPRWVLCRVGGRRGTGRERVQEGLRCGRTSRTGTCGVGPGSPVEREFPAPAPASPPGPHDRRVLRSPFPRDSISQKPSPGSGREGRGFFLDGENEC